MAVNETFRIHLAATPEMIARCHPVMRELRPHFGDAGAFVSAVMEQQQEAGYRLAFLEHEGAVRTVSGYRIFKSLSFGRHVYVDDLVTRAEDHGKGFGSAMFDWLLAEARREGCANLQLDSGVHRFAAHRFYLVKGMDITCHHFSIGLT